VYYDAAVSRFPTATSVELGTRIRLLRELTGWRQADLAAAIGVSPGSLSLYERGIVEPRFSQLDQLCTVLDLPLSILTAAEVDYRAIRRRTLERALAHLQAHPDLTLDELLLGPTSVTPLQKTALFSEGRAQSSIGIDPARARDPGATGNSGATQRRSLGSSALRAA
jgi:transcriptional regulator with XRE-family HTH domain